MERKDEIERGRASDSLELATSLSPEEAMAFDLEEVLAEDAPPGQQKPKTARINGSNVPKVVRPPK